MEMTDNNKRILGLIINPIAGMGGKAGLKGSDDIHIREKAMELGVRPESSMRTEIALEALLPIMDQIQVLTYGGSMGEDKLVEMGFAPKVVGNPEKEYSTAEDTIRAARIMKEAGAELILFAGGDGTARNICEAIEQSLPVVGIPAGVKIHSGVYAINPRNAGFVARDFLENHITTLKEAEVMDIDEEKFSRGIVEARLYGYMMVPYEERRIQSVKNGGTGSEQEDLVGVATYLVDDMEEDVYYIIGPGSTTKYVMDDMELPNTLLGVDLVKNRELVASDLTEGQLWDILGKEDVQFKVILTIIGGQGNLFGRGNQQISPRIIRKAGKKNLIVIATRNKLEALEGRPLLVDTGDAELDEELRGYIEVTIDYAQTTIWQVEN